MDQVLSPLVVTSDPRVFNQQLPEPPGPRCELAPWGGPELVPALVCALCCFFSVVYCCFGYRCFKAVMFLSGLFAGSLVIFLLCYRERVLETQLSLEVSAGIALGIGLLCGLVTVLVRSVGLFLTGLLLGLALGAGALLATEPWYRPPSAWVPAGLLVGLALLGALMTLRWPRPFTILGTALLGAAGLVACADYLVEGLALGGRLGQRLRAVPGLPPLCWYSWALLGAWPALGTLGAVAQWRLTAEGRGRPDAPLSRRRERLRLLQLRQREAKRRQSHGPGSEGGYRRPPPPRARSPADGLAPSYLRSLRDRPRAPRSAPHTVLDLDYDSGSTTPLTAPPAGRP
ncbi:transmembrane protein 198 [Ornithorhynchus anatinus]|uniref:transmembrane protein 198 n=1 Tax=Ornithorhynchus anatinus TaxID=9258 RepID=UPI0010A8E5BF|nr:transmembrane protein 198 [Ornithorhynchus anatinus]XP_028928640.1 transmembrane protein 198 [Ornithorhynchus anatinus]XP_028928644.1 transmembrane protein 198 [Ornithorhynchus anatinus]